MTVAILLHHRDFDQDTPQAAARAAISQADIWGTAEALGLKISPEINQTKGMNLYISGPLHHIMDLYETAETIGASPGISHIEVDTKEDEDILRNYLGREPKVVNPGMAQTRTPRAS